MTITVSNKLSKYRFFNSMFNNKKFEVFLKNFCSICMIIVFVLSLSLESVVPFNYIAIGVAAIFAIATIVYILIYGSFTIDIYIFLLSFFLLIQYISFIANAFACYTKTPTLMCFLSFFVYEFFIQLNKKEKDKLFNCLCLSSLFLIILFSIYYFNDIISPNFSNRIGDYFGNQNDVARHFAFVLLCMLILIWKFKNLIFKIVFSLLAVYSFYLILLTGSVSNTICALLSLAVFIFMLFPKNKKWIFVLLTIASVAIITIVINLPAFSYFKTRITNMFNSLFNNDGSTSTDNSSISRFHGALYGFKLLLQNPFFGNGYKSVYRNYFIMSHNNISEVAASFGIIGLIVEELMICLPLFKRRGNSKVEIILINFYIFMFQLFLVSYNAKIEAILLPITFCLSGYQFDFFFARQHYYEVFI